MNYNAPQLILTGSSITAIQNGDAGEPLSSKISTHSDAPPNMGYSLASVPAYQADE